MLANAIGAVLLLSRLNLPNGLRLAIRTRLRCGLAGLRVNRRLAVIVADNNALDHAAVGDNRRICSRRKLNGRRRHQRINDIRSLGPRILLFLRHLHGEVHRLLGLGLPVRTAGFVNVVFTNNSNADLRQQFFVEVFRDVLGLDPAQQLLVLRNVRLSLCIVLNRSNRRSPAVRDLHGHGCERVEGHQ